MRPIYWPQVKSRKYKTFRPEEHYDIKDEIFHIPDDVEHVKFEELINYPSRSKHQNAILLKSSDDDHYSLEPINTFAIGELVHSFHSTTFQEVKALSPYIHETDSLTVVILQALADAFRTQDGLINFSYVRCCPEQIYAMSYELKNEILMLDNTDLYPIALEWQTMTQEQYKFQNYESKKDHNWYYYWGLPHDLSYYTIEYFTDILLNLYELVRYCEPEDTIYISVDY